VRDASSGHVRTTTTAEATRALREMLSADRLTKLMPMKVDGGRIEAVQIEQEGPIACVESTSLAKVFEEDANRCLLLHTDERPEPPGRVVNPRARASGGGRGGGAAVEAARRPHALQRLLEPFPVVVPFAGRLAEHSPSDGVEAR